MQAWLLDKCDGVNLNYVCATCVEEKKISDRNNDDECCEQLQLQLRVYDESCNSIYINSIEKQKD